MSEILIQVFVIAVIVVTDIDLLIVTTTFDDIGMEDCFHANWNKATHICEN